jgi:hypothetical protein
MDTNKPPSLSQKLETELVPEELFRQLMQASSDGSVPEHLISRLRQLEQRKPVERVAEPNNKHLKKPRRSSVDEELYKSFAQMLLEDEP